MAHAIKTVFINRLKKVVFDFLADGLNNPKWRESVLDISLASGTPGQLGAVYKQGSKGPLGRRIDADYKIVEIIPDTLIKFDVIKGPARPSGKFELTDYNDQAKLIFTLDLEPRGLAKLMEPMIQKTMEKEVQMLENLKKYLEK